MNKKIFLICLMLLARLLAIGQVARTDTGMIKGSKYIILFPSGWKGKLVMYTHGYEFMGSTPRQSQNPQFSSNMKPFLDRGFAVAAADYSQQGYAIPQGVEETEALRKYFVGKYGQPDTTFIVGHSMGGGIALATIENFGQYYNGGLPLCPLSSRSYIQVRKEFDLYASFNALFPGIVPKLSEIFDRVHPLPATPFAEMFPKINKIREGLQKYDSVSIRAFAARFDLHAADLPLSLFFNENVLRDIAEKTNGNPFDNTNTVYNGFENDLLVNEKVERLKVTADPNKLFGAYDRTGNINKPVVLMHTLYDQLIPVRYGVINYENMVHQNGKDQYLSVYYTNGSGHCSFSPQQVSEAFDDLRHWVSTNTKAQPGQIK